MKTTIPCVSAENIKFLCCESRARILGTGIEVLTRPAVNYCPLHEALHETRRIDADAVRKAAEAKIAEYGFCCKDRVFDTEPIVAYGTSEMMRLWLRQKHIDCAVVACEEAGTVTTAEGELAGNRFTTNRNHQDSTHT